MIRVRCEHFANLDVAAPRPGCPCHACYRERSTTIQPLIDLLHQHDLFGMSAGPALVALQRWIQLFCAGKIGRDEMMIAAIRDLVQVSQDIYKQILEVTALQALQPITIPRGTPPDAPATSGG